MSSAAPCTRLRWVGIAAATVAIAMVPLHAEDDKKSNFDGQVELLYRTVSVDGSMDKYNYDFAGLSGGTRLGSTFMEWQNVESD